MENEAHVPLWCTKGGAVPLGFLVGECQEFRVRPVG